MEVFLLLILIGIIPGMIAKSKGRSFIAWWVYGAALFIIALVHSLLIKPDRMTVERDLQLQGMKKCPFCAEMIQGEAKVCRYCGRDLPLDEKDLYETEGLSETEKVIVTKFIKYRKEREDLSVDGIIINMEKESKYRDKEDFIREALKKANVAT